MHTCFDDLEHFILVNHLYDGYFNLELDCDWLYGLFSFMSDSYLIL